MANSLAALLATISAAILTEYSPLIRCMYHYACGLQNRAVTSHEITLFLLYC